MCSAVYAMYSLYLIQTFPTLPGAIMSAANSILSLCLSITESLSTLVQHDMEIIEVIFS